MKKTLLFAIFLFSTLFSFAQDRLFLKSSKIPGTDTVIVFKPKQYDYVQKVPVVFLLHGWSANYKQWDKTMDAQKYADEYNVLIVCPDGFYDSWYLNSPLKPNSQYVDFFYETLLPKIKSDYRIDDKNLFITGLSMGGHGALNIFLEHPEVFRSAGSTSGGVYLEASGDRFGINKVVGSFQTALDTWKAYSIVTKIDKLKGIDKQIIFDCGTEDFFYEANNMLRAKCDSLKIKATYITQPGGHDPTYWKKSIKQQFEFFRELMLN
ncbi:esterase family protein [Solitalea sp. MAHUQ-68]|uniref:Esterase family protein n=1 Tax=Solitalea agri TaxID=2953739 RepID=A0A9X2JBT9_9SPHI|nr:alpha/beta hydrolase family protein [Solitalea agri]MCO4291819.1 esterase family protein [Solitalea agri]